MIKINLTKVLAKDLKVPDVGVADTPAGMSWYAHRVTIARRKCVVAMEEHTRYAMVFCGLTQAEFEVFPELFFERLVSESSGIISELAGDKTEIFAEFMEGVCTDQVYQVSSDRSVSSHISQVVQDLRIDVEHRGMPLPVDVEDAINFGLSANGLLRKRKGDKDYFVPIEAFHLLCMNMWLHSLEDTYGPLPSREETNNVIAVDFKNRNRAEK